jgi:CheY-like chemotaxis protein
MSSFTREQTPVYVAVFTITAIIFALDCFTQLGIAAWIFYLVPVAASILQRARFLPLVTVGVQSVLMAIAWALKPDGVAEQLSAFNRIAGAFALVAMGFLAARIIMDRSRTQRFLWLQRGQSQVTASLLGEESIEVAGYNVLKTLCAYVDAQVGLMHRLERNQLSPVAGYGIEAAADGSFGPPSRFGLASEAAHAGRVISVQDVPDDYLRVSTSLGSAMPRRILIAPISAEGQVWGVVELGFFQNTDDFDDKIELLERVGGAVGLAVRTAAYREHLNRLLVETQRQSEELQVQQEELRVSNEELEEQGRVLRESQTRLENQQAELEQTNVQLEEQTQRLEHQKSDLEGAQRTLRISSDELERANKYKSEFLANMSHELRTPLNSSLILSQILSDPKSDNLDAEQVRSYAKTIHASNNDLLSLINDILDLSKIEAGHVEVQPEPVSIAGLVQPIRQMFEPIAADKQLAFTVEIAPNAPMSLVTDIQRLQQIIKNLLSNAFKFTQQGGVTLRVAPAANGRTAFSVSDTGIGIAPAQQNVIFDAFRQADGTTSRKYGGTGLGLSISRELARLLGGELRVASAPGEGSTFTVEVSTELEADAAPDARRAPEPLHYQADGGAPEGASALEPLTPRRRRGDGELAPAAAHVPDSLRAAPAASAAKPAATAVAAPRNTRDRLILVIEDDTRFAEILGELAAELNFDFVHAENGQTAIALAHELRPSGILLDVNLPDQSGLAVLDQLKRDPVTRHIPIHMMSVEDHTQTALELGAIGYAIKPVAREDLIAAFSKVEEKLRAGTRRVLVVEDDDILRANIALLLAADDVEITVAATGAEALDYVASTTFDCMVMDLMLPDASGYELLEQMSDGEKYSFPPVIVYTGRALTRDEEQRLRRYSKSIIIKGAKSPERLLDEVTLFLHRVEATLPPDQQKLLKQARQRDTLFESRKILLVEDDVRNIFALSSILEPLGAKLIITRNGREALDYLERDKDVDLVLMDLMMPEMDGLTAMRHIRRRPDLAKLPVIALTAKAMADDRRVCLEAGANDYIAKPIDVDKLVSLCRVWMPK